MIKIYENGNAFVEENDALLQTNKYLACFFYLDAPLITKCDKVNYAIRVTDGDARLLVMKVEPYNLMLFGDTVCLSELAAFLIGNGYEVKNILAADDVGSEFTAILEKEYGIPYYESLGMDFMESCDVTEPSSCEVEAATESDLDEIVWCLEHFDDDCGLADKIVPENVLRIIRRFRVIRRDGMIVSMARIDKVDETYSKILAVYTRPEYRGMGYARKVVSTAMNEIIASGRIATLNVDKKNPISNHLYASLGFRRVFSQSEYRRK